MIDCSEAIGILRKHGASRIAVCGRVEDVSQFPEHAELERIAVLQDQDYHDASNLKSGWSACRPSEVPDEIDGILIIDAKGFRVLMRKLEPLARRNCLILPADRDWVVPRSLWEADAMYAAWNTSAAANYVARCNLKGHYLEFGTFWGGSFFPNYFRFRHWLRGSFVALDSFHGLSTPNPDETKFTGGDFQVGAYCANARSFIALADFLGIPADRFSVIPGFFSETLNGVPPQRYDLEPGSVSVCCIDCDLKEPTEQVLHFLTPLLETGALLYFDDWRLCRASRQVGERAAALEWLSRHPDVELVEFDRDSWQHQWFIFQRT